MESYIKGGRFSDSEWSCILKEGGLVILNGSRILKAGGLVTSEWSRILKAGGLVILNGVVY